MNRTAQQVMLALALFALLLSGMTFVALHAPAHQHAVVEAHHTSHYVAPRVDVPPPVPTPSPHAHHAKRPVRPSPSAQPASRDYQRPPLSLAAAWARVRLCESGGDYSLHDPPFYGAYQFMISTWASVGGRGNPADAPPAEQDYRAQKLYERDGKGQWPICGTVLP